MAEKARIHVSPMACVYHDREKYTIEVDLEGVDKKNIDFAMSEASFCLKAPMKDLMIFGCWMFAHNIIPKKARATFKNGLLTVTAPLAKPLESVNVSIE